MTLSMLGGISPSIVYNSTLIKKGEITSYKDLLKPQYKGRITINDPSTTGAGLGFIAFLSCPSPDIGTRGWVKGGPTV